MTGRSASTIRPPGEGSRDCSPGFVNASGRFERLDDFRLVEDSPCRGAGRDEKNMGRTLSELDS